MDIMKEVLKFNMKNIEDYDGNERASFNEILEIKDVTEDTYKLNKKIYIGLDNLKYNYDSLTKQLEEKDDVIFNLKKYEFELNKELDESIKKIVELSDLIISIYDFAVWKNEIGWINSLEKTIKANDETINAVGLSRINSLGEKFDGNIHYCKGIEKREGAETDIIINVLREGYRYKGKVYRNPEVVISK